MVNEKCKYCGCDMVFEETPMLKHYGKVYCKNCNHFDRWVPKPDSDPTKYRRKKNTTNLARHKYCQMCLRYKEDLPDNQTLEGHHVIPVKYGGSNDKSNVWTLCTGCHRLVEWMRTYHSSGMYLAHTAEAEANHQPQEVA